MGFAFNPFTGNFDQKGSGGGGSSYIDGEVQNFSALPETLGTPAVDSAYLVREAEGTWLLNRKPAGIYIRTANTGTRASDWTYAGEFPDVFSDANFVLYDNGDSTKNLQFQLSGIDTATTRTLTAPNASGTIARTEDFAAPPAIGNTTPNSGAFTTLSANNGTLTASAPVLDLSQTWNNSGTAFTAVKLNITNTASAFNTSGSKLVDISIDGSANILNIYRSSVASPTQAPVFEFGNAGVASRMRVRTGGGVGVNFDGTVGVGGSLQLGVSTGTSNGDVILSRDAADTLALVRGTNPQTFRLYNTFTDASNYERGFMRWSSNVLQIGTEKAGTGSARALEFQVDGTTRLAIASNGGVTVSAGFVGTGNIRASSFSCGTANNGISFGDGFTFITGPSTAGVLTINAFNNTDVLVRLGGTSSSWPALNTSGSTLRIRLADNTGFAPLSCGALTLNGNLDASAQNIVTDTTTGTKIGTGTTQKIGFFNATPVVQQAAIADATDAATTQARLNDLLAVMRTFGLIAT